MVWSLPKHSQQCMCAVGTSARNTHAQMVPFVSICCVSDPKLVQQCVVSGLDEHRKIYPKLLL